MKRRLCDYEGSDYEAFWPGREYEDAAERIALRRLLPPKGETLVELGAGFGRLADLYRGYKRVILLDFARSQLLEAHQRFGEGNFIYMAADIYRLPLASSVVDTAVTVRVLHHIADIPAALAEVHRILKPEGTYILEYANKRNLKEIFRYLLGRSQKRPFSHEPYEYLDMHFNFHPAYISASLRQAGFALEGDLAVSQFRLPLLKRFFAPGVLACLDGLLQKPTALLKLSPSIFVAARAVKKERETPASLFRCLYCYAPLQESVKDPEGKETTLFCPGCGQQWRPQEGIYDFRETTRVQSILVGIELSRQEPEGGWQAYRLDVAIRNPTCDWLLGVALDASGGYVETEEGYTYPAGLVRRSHSGIHAPIETFLEFPHPIPPGFTVRRTLRWLVDSFYEEAYYVFFKAAHNTHPTRLIFPRLGPGESGVIDLENVGAPTFRAGSVIGSLPTTIEFPGKAKVTIGTPRDELRDRGSAVKWLTKVANLKFQNLHPGYHQAVNLNFALIADNGLVVPLDTWLSHPVLSAGPAQTVESDVCFMIRDEDRQLHFYMIVYGDALALYDATD